MNLNIIKKLYFLLKRCSHFFNCLLLFLLLLSFSADGYEHFDFEKQEGKFITCQNPKWARDFNNPHSGDYSFKSQNIKIGSTSSVCIKNFSEPGSLIFFWNLSGKIDNDKLIFIINGRPRAFCRSNSWVAEGPFDLERGDLLEWKFEKGTENGSGYIDDAVFFKPNETDKIKSFIDLFKNKTAIGYAGLLEPVAEHNGRNKTPIILSLEPDKSSPQNSGAIITWTIEALDPNSKKLSYIFSINGSDVTRWQEEKQWIWDTKGVIGCFDINVKVRNVDGFENDKTIKFTIEPYYVNKNNYDYKRNIFPTIQQAIDLIPANGMIVVAPGFYNEHISIEKPLSLVGTNLLSVISQGDDDLIYINSHNVTVGGFTISGGDIGISTSNGKNVSLVNNKIQNSEICGINSIEPEGISISGNSILNCSKGIHIYGGKDSFLDSNKISDIRGDGINGEYIEDTKIINNTINISENGIILLNSNKNTLKNNTICNIVNTIIAIINSNDNNISEDTMCYSDYGIHLGENSYRNTISTRNAYSNINKCKVECYLPVPGCGNNSVPSNISHC